MATSAIPRFSVVIPLYNKRPYVRRAVESVLGQSYHDFELIVVDDGSTDSGAETLADIKDARLNLVCQTNRGVGAARNTGMAQARGAWLALLDADDAWLPHHLAELARIADTYPQAGMISCNCREVMAENIPAAFEGKNGIDTIRQVNYFEEAARHKGFINASSVAIRRDAAHAVGGFSSRKAGEDIEYWVKVALLFPVAISARFTCLYFRDTGGVIQQLVETGRDQPEPQPSSLRDFSAGVGAILAKADQDPDLLKRQDIRAYINGMLMYAIRGSLYNGYYRNARHYAGMLIRPLHANELAFRMLARLPEVVLQAIRAVYLYIKLKKNPWKAVL